MLAEHNAFLVLIIACWSGCHPVLYLVFDGRGDVQFLSSTVHNQSFWAFLVPVVLYQLHLMMDLYLNFDTNEGVGLLCVLIACHVDLKLVRLCTLCRCQ